MLEILVVVVIIAVMTTIAVLSIGVLGGDRELDSEGDRFTDVIAAAEEQAELEGRDYGVWFGPARYEVLAFSVLHQRWEPLPDDRLYMEHDMPAGVTTDLSMEGRPVKIGLDAATTVRVPQVILFASGDCSPYHLVFGREGADTQWTIDGLADGTLQVTRPGAKP